MSVLLVTRSDDNESVELVASALRSRGETPIRLNSDLYPLEVRLSTRYADSRRRELVTPEGRFDLDEVRAVWYRRFLAGGTLPDSLGDTREACVDESRRTLYGTIAALTVFQLDPIGAVRKADHKEVQLLRARALGLDVPKTLFTNDPDAVRRFWDEVGGRMITKMQSSFAIYRGGREHVVYTNEVKRLEDLDGLRFCPMVFQELVPKTLELRATVVGKQVFTAAVDSQKADRTRVDWRRDGIGLIDAWTPYSLPAAVQDALVALTADFGLNYSAADFIVTPDGRHVFLEINAGGEWFWLQRKPGLPIAEAIADRLAGHASIAKGGD